MSRKHDLLFYQDFITSPFQRTSCMLFYTGFIFLSCCCFSYKLVLARTFFYSVYLALWNLRCRCITIKWSVTYHLWVWPLTSRLDYSTFTW